MKTATMRRIVIALTIAVLILAIMITVAFGATASGKVNVGSEPAEPMVVAEKPIVE